MACFRFFFDAVCCRIPQASRNDGASFRGDPEDSIQKVRRYRSDPLCGTRRECRNFWHTRVLRVKRKGVFRS
jgi:hypothetical protein